jgi:hypothetical protein
MLSFHLRHQRHRHQLVRIARMERLLLLAQQMITSVVVLKILGPLVLFRNAMHALLALTPPPDHSLVRVLPILTFHQQHQLV